jgi:transcriptional regulator of acetoin/glycerol metabolism
VKCSLFDDVAARAVPAESPVVEDGVTEASRILALLRKHNNNRRRAATELGISRVAFYKKLHRYGLFVSKSDKFGRTAQPVAAESVG